MSLGQAEPAVLPVPATICPQWQAVSLPTPPNLLLQPAVIEVVRHELDEAVHRAGEGRASGEGSNRSACSPAGRLNGCTVLRNAMRLAQDRRQEDLLAG